MHYHSDRVHQGVAEMYPAKKYNKRNEYKFS